MSKLTIEQLRTLLCYSQTTGLFKWRRQHGRIKANTQAGYQDGRNRIIIMIYGKNYYANVLAWAYVTGQWPTLAVDHEDRDRTNNRWRNLRQATTSQNLYNRPAQANNRTGLKGVSPRGKKFRARISFNLKQIGLGNFATATEAKQAYDAAARKLHGKFACLQ